MSRCIERLNSTNKPAMPAMGFRTAATVERVMSMIVIADITGRTDDDIKAISGLEVAAVIADSTGLTASSLGKQIKNVNGMASGLNVSGGKAGGWKLVTADIDFVIFDKDTQIAAFENKSIDSMGKILCVDFDMGSTLLRSLGGLYPDMEAVCIDLTDAAITIKKLMDCRRVADMTGRPVLARVNGSLSDLELLAMRGAGIKGLVLQKDAGVDQITDILNRVAALPKPDKKKSQKDVALLPQLGLPPVSKGDDDGDGNGDDGE